MSVFPAPSFSSSILERYTTSPLFGVLSSGVMKSALFLGMSGSMESDLTSTGKSMKFMNMVMKNTTEIISPNVIPSLRLRWRLISNE